MKKSTMRSNMREKALVLHKKYAGKIAIENKIPIENKGDLSLAYSPGVAEVSRAIYENSEEARNMTFKRNSVAVVSDGSAVLGLGDLGPLPALPVMEGKAALFKRFAGIDAVPIVLDAHYTDDIVKVVKALAPTFGGINLEDISAPRCFKVEERLRKDLSIPVMHDDQHGTAIVVLAGLLNACKIRALDRRTAKIVVNGAGAAGVAVVKMLLTDGFRNVIVSDSNGALYQGRGEMGSEKEKLSMLTNIACRIDVDDPRCATGGIETSIQGADVFIGVSRGGVLTEEMVKSMNPDPIIFALANPEPEIMPGKALRAGASIVATGRSDFPNQVNNVLAFPGLFRGALDSSIAQFTDAMFLGAARALAACVKKPTPNKIIPDPFDAGVAEAVANAVKKEKSKKNTMSCTF